MQLGARMEDEPGIRFWLGSNSGVAEDSRQLNWRICWWRGRLGLERTWTLFLDTPYKLMIFIISVYLYINIVNFSSQYDGLQAHLSSLITQNFPKRKSDLLKQTSAPTLRSCYIPKLCVAAGGGRWKILVCSLDIWLHMGTASKRQVSS